MRSQNKSLRIILSSLFLLTFAIYGQAQTTLPGPVGVGEQPHSNIGWGSGGGQIVTVGTTNQASAGFVVHGLNQTESAFGVSSNGETAIDVAGNTDATKNLLLIRIQETDLPTRYAPSEQMRIDAHAVTIQKQLIVPRASAYWSEFSPAPVIQSGVWTPIFLNVDVDDPFQMHAEQGNNHLFNVVRDGSYGANAVVCFIEPSLVAVGVRGVRFRATNSANGNFLIHKGALINAVPSVSGNNGTCVSAGLPTTRFSIGETIQAEVFQNSGVPLSLDPSEFGISVSVDQR